MSNKAFRSIIESMFYWFFAFSCTVLAPSINTEIPQEKVEIDFTKITVDSLRVLCNTSVNRGKTIGVFGGSYSIIEGSEIVKDSWCTYLNAYVTDYGVGGYGFSREQGSIQNEVDYCDSKDIYVLWASTNDFNNNRRAGKPTDYSESDSFCEAKRSTQCGGINYCIKSLREKNPNCLIVMISSSKFFQTEKGYDMSKKNAAGESLKHLVDMQMECCRINRVPFVNLLDCVSFSEEDFCPDLLHYNNQGYSKLVLPTTLLISRPEWFLQ